MYRRLGWVGLGPPPNHLPGAAVEFSAYARQSPICTSCLRRRPFAFLFAAGPRILHSREPEAKINRVERFNFITATFLITCVLCEASPLVGSRCLSYISPKLKFGRLTHTHTHSIAHSRIRNRFGKDFPRNLLCRSDAPHTQDTRACTRFR